MTQYVRVKRFIVYAMAAVFLAACAPERLYIPVKDAITVEQLAAIKKGTTHKDDIEKIFGTPLDKLVFPNGRETWFYKDFNMKPLWIEFDAGGMVKKFNAD
ncbi:MAG: hypothetical protein IEMM0002_1499 [bacterium]|nr:MAG: hypothetical protein IEMM0002_1499 [bacterium]